MFSTVWLLPHSPWPSDFYPYKPRWFVLSDLRACSNKVSNAYVWKNESKVQFIDFSPKLSNYACVNYVGPHIISFSQPPLNKTKVHIKFQPIPVDISTSSLKDSLIMDVSQSLCMTQTPFCSVSCPHQRKKRPNFDRNRPGFFLVKWISCPKLINYECISIIKQRFLT